MKERYDQLLVVNIPDGDNISDLSLSVIIKNEVVIIFNCSECPILN